VKLFRAILNIVAPHVILITETNVPHPENVSYFGNGRDEAQMVYNFTLPPLLFHTFAKEDASALTQWAKQLEAPSTHTTFFNFTASHDGIGVRPLEGVLARQEIDDLAAIALAGGGQVSYKRNPDGSESPYELNITYIDAILSGNPDGPPEKFLASQAIQYVLPGVPATYIHSLLGSRNWHDGVKTTGRARTINREQLDAGAIEEELARETSFRARIFHPYLHLMRTRRNEPAFHPNADFEVLDIEPSLFAVKRQTDSRQVLALTNVSSKPVSVSLKKHTAGRLVDLLSGREFDTKDLIVPPYQSVWLAGPSQARD
jgi:glycosidase